MYEGLWNDSGVATEVSNVMDRAVDSCVLTHWSKYGRVSKDADFKLPLLKLNSRGFILSVGTLNYAFGINNCNGL